MFPLVEIPEIVRHYESFFTPVFSPQALEQFKRYVSGLILSDNKTVEGINRLFVFDVRNQSSLNRLLTESPFSVEKLHQARLTLLSSVPGTQLKRKGVLSIDDTLLTHYGQQFEKIAPLYDSVHQRYVWAHNLVNLHYSDDDTDYPIDFTLWEPADVETLEVGLQAAGVTLRESKFALKESDPKKWRTYLLGVWRRHQHKPGVQDLYQSKLLLGQALLAQFQATHPDQNLPVTFDSWYTQPAFCRYLDKVLKMAYVGTLDGDTPIKLTTGEPSVSAFAQQLQEKHQQALESGKQPLFKKISITYKGEKETYYSYCALKSSEQAWRGRRFAATSALQSARALKPSESLPSPAVRTFGGSRTGAGQSRCAAHRGRSTGCSCGSQSPARQPPQPSAPISPPGSSQTPVRPLRHCNPPGRPRSSPKARRRCPSGAHRPGRGPADATHRGRWDASRRCQRPASWRLEAPR